MRRGRAAADAAPLRPDGALPSSVRAEAPKTPSSGGVASTVSGAAAVAVARCGSLTRTCAVSTRLSA